MTLRRAQFPSKGARNSTNDGIKHDEKYCITFLQRAHCLTRPIHASVGQKSLHKTCSDGGDFVPKDARVRGGGYSSSLKLLAPAAS